MHEHTATLLRHLDDSRAKLAAAVEAVPEAQRERAPAAGWSVANVLTHLAQVEQQVVTLLRRGLRRALADGALPVVPPGPSPLDSIDGALLLDRTRRIDAPGGAMPDPAVGLAEAWQRLDESRRAARELLLAADGGDTSSIVAPHPLLGPLTFAAWFAFLGYHEQRHAAQVAAIGEQLADQA